MNRRIKSKSRFQSYQQLEAKNLLAAIYHNPDSGILYIAGDSGANVGQVSVSGDNVVAQIDGQSYSGASDDVTDIIFIGYDGNDTFTNLSDLDSSMYGHLGNDTLTGGGGDDNLVGGAGNDTIQGLDGDDRIVGADGNDTLEGGDGEDRIFGTAGTNTIYGGAGDDTIYGSEDADEIYGDAGADKIYALGGDDILYTGTGGVEGGSFDEGDLAMGHGGDDEFYGSTGLNIFYGGDGDDIMVGGSGENRMHGQAGDDTLTGGEKGDYMTGADGDDTFDGRGGVDYYNVGDGSDTIVYSQSYVPTDVHVTNNGGTAETRIQNELVSNATWVQFADRTISADQAYYLTVDETNFSSLNGYRVSSSVGFVSKPSDLADFAYNWSLQMASAGTLSHSTESDRASLYVGDRSAVGENVAMVSDTGQSDVQIANYFLSLWQSSSAHNSNLLNSNYQEVGIGIVKSGGAWWATQIFMG
ncbi:CAP domain-containing protein [Mariniblastus fucicola]|uniref:Bifunctional hemolysin/adenylate cyclase n=1 Tax=Mariniblastus fucicola TaxID=980251 RepID=A0A5B9P4Q3_9BACT|nr:CAP domain-containing protein [Mariniblastus fucicola]QEG21587.1 Bifunctional hemolysin/adenylate cyclase precursor [Mariniblastus fucicola]